MRNTKIAKAPHEGQNVLPKRQVFQRKHEEYQIGFHVSAITARDFEANPGLAMEKVKQAYAVLQERIHGDELEPVEKMADYIKNTPYVFITMADRATGKVVGAFTGMLLNNKEMSVFFAHYLAVRRNYEGRNLLGMENKESIKKAAEKVLKDKGMPELRYLIAEVSKPETETTGEILKGVEAAEYAKIYVFAMKKLYPVAANGMLVPYYQPDLSENPTAPVKMLLFVGNLAEEGTTIPKKAVGSMINMLYDAYITYDKINAEHVNGLRRNAEQLLGKLPHELELVKKPREIVGMHYCA